MFTSGAVIIGIVFMLISMAVQARLKSKFKKYSQVPNSGGLSGAQVAFKMLSDNGITDVKIISTPGHLSDHYNPQDKTVNLSKTVYNGRSIASAAIAAHECGHAVQHAQAYSMLSLRSALVPLQNVAGTVMNTIVMISIFGGMFLYNAFPYDMIIMVVVASYGVITLFSLVTLPVEFDASHRALNWIAEAGIVSKSEYNGAKDALWWAAMTYVVAAMGSLATMLYYLSILSGGDD